MGVISGHKRGLEPCPKCIGGVMFADGWAKWSRGHFRFSSNGDKCCFNCGCVVYVRLGRDDGGDNSEYKKVTWISTRERRNITRAFRREEKKENATA